MSAPAELAADALGSTPGAFAAHQDPAVEHARALTGRPTLKRADAHHRYRLVTDAWGRIGNKSALARMLGCSEARVRQLLIKAQTALASEGATS